jgi:protein-S-isoprenylcysteine O-methyltransferase Ste14
MIVDKKYYSVENYTYIQKIFFFLICLMEIVLIFLFHYFYYSKNIEFTNNKILLIRSFIFIFTGLYLLIEIIVFRYLKNKKIDPYKYIRYPELTGIYSLFFGLGYLLTNIVSILFIPFWFIYFKYNEKIQEKKYGDEYISYRDKTGMCIPNNKYFYLFLALYFFIPARYFYLEIFNFNFGTFLCLLPLLFIFLFFWKNSKNEPVNKSTIISVSSLFVVIVLLFFNDYDNVNKARENINYANYYNCIIAQQITNSSEKMIMTNLFAIDPYKIDYNFIKNNTDELNLYTETVIKMESVNNLLKVVLQANNLKQIEYINKNIISTSGDIKRSICEKFYDQEYTSDQLRDVFNKIILNN